MNNNLGRFRVSVVTNAAAVSADPVPKRVRDLRGIPIGRLSVAQFETVFSYWRTTVQEFKEANEKIEALWKEWPNGATALTLMARGESRDTHILKRGDWLKPQDTVMAGVPAFLHPIPPDTESGRIIDALANPAGSRLAFARWLTSKRSPTTARAIVNRVWQAYFGIGIVTTPEDFGMQSDAPTHPELLDWLACDLMLPTWKSEANSKFESVQPWSLKHIHRLIVTSATYRQSSKVTPELYTRDPYNRLLARGSRLRVEGEIVRDIALSASGLLNPKIGGPAIFSPAPDFLFQPPASYAPFPWKEETGADRYRRAVYTFRRRSTPARQLELAIDLPKATEQGPGLGEFLTFRIDRQQGKFFGEKHRHAYRVAPRRCVDNLRGCDRSSSGRLALAELTKPQIEDRFRHTYGERGFGKTFPDIRRRGKVHSQAYLARRRGRPHASGDNPVTGRPQTQQCLRIPPRSTARCCTL